MPRAGLEDHGKEEEHKEASRKRSPELRPDGRSPWRVRRNHEKDERPDDEAPRDEVVLEVEEDRARLLLQGVLYLLLAFFGLFLVAGGIGATQISQNMAYMILLLIGLPLAWFASKAMGRRLGKFFSRTNVIDFCRHGVVIYEGSDPKKALSVSYKDIKNYRVVRHGKSLRLLLGGAWVTHPSGLYFVDINRPFMESTLDSVEADVRRIMRENRVNERK